MAFPPIGRSRVPPLARTGGSRPPNRPFATYAQYGGEALAYGDDSVPDKINGYFQINVWATSRMEASGLMRQIEAALIAAAAFQARPLAALRTESEPDLDLYGASQDFSIWSARP
jgi:hypothetical protein